MMNIISKIDKYLGEAGKNKEPKKWMGSIPKKCDICGGSLEKGWVDGAINMGPWANMCMKCFKKHGKGLGTGKGQKYNKDGVKVGG
jgi:hypothetical protein